jgi:hypothetical protein
LVTAIPRWPTVFLWTDDELVTAARATLLGAPVVVVTVNRLRALIVALMMFVLSSRSAAKYEIASTPLFSALK